MSERFDRWARQLANISGSWQASLTAVSLVLGWCIAGLWIGFANLLFQMVINTITTIITFLMVFVIQHTQTRDTEAIQVKLDELLRAVDKARNDLIGIEQRPESEVRGIAAVLRPPSG